MKDNHWLGWHWLSKERKCRFVHHDKIKAGMTLDNPVDRYGKGGPIMLCERGYHASENILDALKYAPGPIVCRVELGGKIIKDTITKDKAVAEQRTCLWMADATNVLHEFACLVAELALISEEQRGCTHESIERARHLLANKRQWMAGTVTDDNAYQAPREWYLGWDDTCDSSTKYAVLSAISAAATCPFSAAKNAVRNACDSTWFAYYGVDNKRHDKSRLYYNRLLTNMISPLAPKNYKEHKEQKV
jgi:hypothetical protein